MNETKNKINKRISLVAIIIFIMILVLIEIIIVITIIKKSNNNNQETISDTSIIITDIQDINPEPLPNLDGTTWKLSIFVEELIGENISENQKQELVNKYSDEYGYIVFNKNKTITCNIPENIANYNIEDNLIVIDTSQKGLKYLNLEGEGIISFAYQNGQFISVTKFTVRDSDITIKSRMRLEKVGTSEILNLKETDWKINHNLKYENLTEEDKKYLEEYQALNGKIVHFKDEKELTIEGEQIDYKYYIMGSVLKIPAFGFDEFIYEDGKFVCNVDETGPNGQTIQVILILTKANN